MQLHDLRNLAAGLAAATLVCACKNDRTSVFTPFGGPSYNVRLIGPAVRVPSGATSFFDFRLAGRDAFVRGSALVAGDPGLIRCTITGPACTAAAVTAGTPCGTTTAAILAACPGISVTMLGPGPGTLNDSRVPAIQGPPTVSLFLEKTPPTVNQYSLTFAAGTGGTGPQAGASFAGLKPNTLYSIALERNRLGVAGRLDLGERLLGLPVGVRDTLVNLGGVPGTVAGSNPRVLFTATSSAAGTIALPTQVNFTNTTVPWAPNADSASVSVLPRYNYIAFYEGDPSVTPTAPRVATMQIGADLDIAGAVVAHAYGPFATAAATAATIATRANVLPTALTVDILDPPVLEGTATYALWFADAAATTFIKATGQYYAIRTRFIAGAAVVDTVLRPAAPTNEFNGQADSVLHRFVVINANLTALIEAQALVFVSIEAAPGAATPSTIARPVWRNMRPGTTGYSMGAATFGDATNLLAPVTFVASGSGLVGIRDDEIEGDLSQLFRPPRGWYYRVSLYNETDGSEVSVGDIMAPFPRRTVNLHEADTSIVDSVITAKPPAIRAAAFQAFAASLGLPASRPYAAFTHVRVSLAPKVNAVATDRARLVVLSGKVPTAVTAAP